MKTIFSRVKISKKYFIFILVFTLLSSVANMLIPSFLATMIDEGVKYSDNNKIILMAVAMVICAVVALVMTALSIKLSAVIATRFSADLRSEIFKSIQNFSSSEMDKFGTASLVTRSTSDITNIQMFLTYFLQLGLMGPFILIAGIFLTAQTGGELSSVLVVSIPVLIISCSIVVFFIIKLQNKLRKQTDEVNTLFLESLEGVRVIRAFNKQFYEKERFGKVNKKNAKTIASSARTTGILMPLVEIIFGVTTVALMAVGTYYVKQGTLEVGALMANNQYIQLILVAIIAMMLVVVMFPKSYTCMKRVAEVLNTETTITDGKKAAEGRPLRSTVEFKDVTFAYPGSEAPVLKDFNFTAKPGQFVAIMGRTGSGKSSVLKLIPRFYDTTFGEVLVDGMNVKDYKVDELRDIIGYVPQKNVLFSGDIASNLNFGKEDGTEQDWEYAAKIACADEFIDTRDDTYHSHIAQGGTNLSGGQRQRMAIARAVMKKPEIYLFDDSFSALDMKTDKTLRQNLRQNMGDSTVIMVAQRVSSVIDADRIIVIEHNEIVGDGKHKELLKNCPLYREIAVLQLGEEAVEREEKA